MAKRCALCGREPVTGHSVSHSNIKNKRRFLPNLQRARIVIDGVPRRVRVCTRCLRGVRKAAG
jgi:large subunit ribosomal protein L28